MVASSGMDVLVHATEAYLSLADSQFSDAMPENAMELIRTNIRSFVANRADINAISGMLLGSMFAGITLSMARVGNVHVIAHSPPG